FAHGVADGPHVMKTLGNVRVALTAELAPHRQRLFVVLQRLVKLVQGVVDPGNLVEARRQVGMRTALVEFSPDLEGTPMGLQGLLVVAEVEKNLPQIEEASGDLEV